MIDKVDTYNSSYLSPKLILLYALILCPHIIAYQATETSYLIIRLLQLVSIVVWIFLFSIKNRTVSPANKSYTFFIHLWWITLIVLSFVKNPIIQFTQIYYWITIWNLILMAQIFWQRNLTHHLYNLVVLFSFLIYLNTFLYILYPRGLWVDVNWIGTGDAARHLFGNYNQTGLIALIAIMLNGIYAIYTGRGYHNMFFVCCTSIITIIVMGSMTSTIGLIVIATYFIFRKLIKHPYSLIILFFILYASFFSLIVWQGQDIQDSSILTEFIENVLGKNTTFSSRTHLWLNSIALIQSDPIWGHGAQSVEWMVTNIGGSGPHNLWLMILLEGGLVLCSMLILIIIITFFSAWKNRTQEGAYAAICLSSMLLMSMFETYYVVCVFFMMLVTYYTKIIKQNQTTTTEQ